MNSNSQPTITPAILPLHHFSNEIQNFSMNDINSIRTSSSHQQPPPQPQPEPPPILSPSLSVRVRSIDPSWDPRTPSSIYPGPFPFPSSPVLTSTVNDEFNIPHDSMISSSEDVDLVDQNNNGSTSDNHDNNGNNLHRTSNDEERGQQHQEQEGQEQEGQEQEGQEEEEQRQQRNSNPIEDYYSPPSQSE